MTYAAHVEVTPRGTVRLVLAGSMILVRHEEILAQLDLALKAELSTEILIDLSDVTSMDSSGIALLLLVRRRARRAGKAFHLTGVRPEVMRHLYLAGLTLLLGLEPPDVADGLSADGRAPLLSDDGAGGRAPGLLEILDERFDVDSITKIRAQLTTYAISSAMSDEDQYKLVLAASEIMANSVLHGGGTGRIRVTRRSDRLFLEISDNGRGIPRRHLGERRPPRPGRIGSQGLWLARKICERVDIDTGPGGTTVRLTFVVSTSD